MQRDQDPSDEFGHAWEDACYRAGTRGLINVLVIAGVPLTLAFVISAIGRWLGLVD